MTAPPEPITTPPESTTTTEVRHEPVPQTTQPKPEVRRRISTKTTPSKNDLLATIETGVLHLTTKHQTNDDAEEKKLTINGQHDITGWYDNDNEDDDEHEWKAAIKEEHDALQKTQVFTRVNGNDYTHQQLQDVIQTKWVVRSRPGGTTTTKSKIRCTRVHRKSQHRRDQRSNASSDHIETATGTRRVSHNYGIKMSTCPTYNQHSSTHQSNLEQQYSSNHRLSAKQTTTYYGNSTNNSEVYGTHHKSFNYICRAY
eukprot:2882205-Amphidinium_carterae.1